MKIAAPLLAFGLLVGLLAAPAGALSCMEPEPVDWSHRFPLVEAAMIGVVDTVESVTTDRVGGGLVLEVHITEVLHGRAPAVATYTVESFDPWGPYYEIGQELAIVVEDGRYVDGNQALCGPWFGAEELRAAAAEYGGTPDQPLGSVAFARLLVEQLLRLFVPWFR